MKKSLTHLTLQTLGISGLIHRNFSVGGLALCAALLLTAPAALAQSGSLDTTFGSGGIVTTAIGSANDRGESVAIQSDGKIVVAGFRNNGSNSDFAIIRYNSDGTLDNTFGSGGKVTTAIGSLSDIGHSVAIQSDGRIVVAGESDNGTNEDFAVVRYNSDGSLDNTFSSDGKVTTAGFSYDYGYSVTIQSDGKIVVAGTGFDGSNYGFALARYNSDGSLDNTFDIDGKLTTDIGSFNDDGRSVAIQSDGRIVVAGYSSNGSNDDFAIARYNSDGGLDTTFDFDGKVTTAIGSLNEQGYSIAIQLDGKIVAGGWSSNGSSDDFAVVRYNSNGSLDTTFSSDGKQTTAIGSAGDYGYSIAIQSDGKIVVSGFSNNGTNNDFAIVRYNSDGSLDTTFSSDGIQTTAIGSSHDEGWSVAFQSDGKIVVAGWIYNGSNDDFALARYLAACSLTSTITKTDVTCPECSTGTVSVNVQGGVFPFIYQWSTGLTDTSVFNQYDLNNIPAGGYGVTVTDNSGCTTVGYTYVTQPSPYTTFLKKYGGTGDDQAYSIAQTADGGCILTGFTTSFGGGQQDVYLVKTDDAGTVQWSAAYGGASFEVGNCVRQTSDGGYIIVGQTFGAGSGGFDVLLMKTDSLGNEQWFQTYGDIMNESGFDVKQTSDGGYIIAGETYTYGYGQNELYLIKTGSNGAMQWAKAYGSSNYDLGRSVVEASDGGFTVAGSTRSYGGGSYDVYLLHTDVNGTMLWTKTFGEFNSDYGYSLVKTPDNGYAIAGTTDNFGAGNFDVWLIKTDVNGTKQWTRTYGGTGMDWAYSLALTSDNGFVITGYTNSFGAGGSDVYFVLTDASGAEQWAWALGDTMDDTGYDIKQSGDGGFIIAGLTNNNTAGSYDMLFMKTDQNGSMQCNSTWVSSASSLNPPDSLSSGGLVTVGGIQLSGVPSPNPPPATVENTECIFQCNISLSITKTDVTCSNNSDGSAMVTASNGTPSYEYFWNNGATTSSINLLPSSIYTVTVSDLTGCTATASATIDVSKPGNWTQMNNFGGTPRYDAVAFSIGTKGYLGTGQDTGGFRKDFWEYDPDSNTWTQKADFLGTPRYSAAGFSIGDKGYIGTGRIDTIWYKDFWEWDQASNTWTPKADFGGTTRWGAAGFSIGTKGYIGTGFDGTGFDDGTPYRKDFWEWDQTSDTWTQKANFGGGTRAVAVGFSIGTKGYIGTGTSANPQYMQDFWEWDQAGNSWTQKSNIEGTRYGAVGFSIGSKGYIGTGNDGSDKQDFWEWDQATDNWTQKATFGGTARRNGAGFSIGTKGYIGTGWDGAPAQDFWEWSSSPDYALTLAKTDVTCYGDSSGTAVASVAGGTPPYSYLWSNGGSTDAIYGVSAGPYTVTLTDANGCTLTASANITQPDALNDTSALIVNPGCYGDTLGLLSYDVTGGTQPFSCLWSTGDTTQMIYNLGAGSYSVTLTDSNNCTISNTFTITTPLALDITTFNPTFISCNGANDGALNPTYTGGNPPYSYLWSNGDTAASITNLTTDTFDVTVTDANGCTLWDYMTLTEPPFVPTYTDTITMILHDGINCIDYPIVKIGNQWWMKENVNNTKYANGSSLVNGTGAGSITGDYTTKYYFNYNDTPAYSNTYGKLYTWAAAMNGAASSDSIPSGVLGVCPAGWHLPGDAEWKQLEMGLGMSQVAADGISWRGTDEGGKLKDIFAWDGTNTSGFSALPSGYRHLSDSTYWYLGSYAEFWTSAGDSGTDAWSRTLGSGSGQISRNLYGKTYGFSARCVMNVNYPPLVVSITNVTNVSCNGLADGSATAAATGGTPPYSYLWSNGETQSAIYNLQFAIYNITVTDAATNTAVDTVTITEPPFVATYTDTVSKILFDERNCTQYPIVKIGNQWWMKENLDVGIRINSSTGGQLQTNNSIIEKYCYNNDPANCSIYGGMYEWNEAMDYNASDNGNPGTTQGICPDGWHIPTDAEWCIMENIIDTSTDPLCNLPGYRGTDVGLKLKDDSLWNGSNASGFSALPAGLRDNSIGAFSMAGSEGYIWTGTENNSLSAWLRNLYITEVRSNRENQYKDVGFSVRCIMNVTSPLTVFITNVTNVTCNGGSDGSAAAYAYGGTPPYTYLWSNGETQSAINNLQFAIYNVTVTDAGSNTVVDSVTITEPPLTTISITVSNVLCNGDSNGCISAFVSAANGYLWSNGSTSPGNCSLPGGMYSVTVTESNGCTVSDSALIYEPLPLLIIIDSIKSPSCQYGWDGAIYTTVTGGNPPYSYYWTGGSSTDDATGLQAAMYSYTVTDTIGCITSSTPVITDPAPFSVWAVGTAISCNGLTDGSAVAGVSTGTLPYTYLWSNASANDTINNLNAGTYYVTTTSGTGCTEVDSVIITDPPLLIITGTTVTSASCSGGSNGQIYVTVTGGTGAYTYQWDSLSGYQTGFTATSLSAGFYTVTVSDSKGCTAGSGSTVTEPSAISVSTTSTDASCNGSNGTTTAAVSGGTPPYIYLWSNGETQSAIYNLQSAIYNVTVTDGLGCTATATATVTELPPPTVNIAFANPKCFGSMDGSATAVVTGGTPPYSYLWNNGETQFAIYNLQSAIYNVTVTDSNACTGTQSINLTEPSQITVTANATNVTTCGGNNGTITVTASGGSGTLQYSIDGSITFQSSNIFSGLTAGTYTIIVKDAANCAKQITAAVDAYAGTIVLTMNSTPVSCNGGSDGIATVTATGGTAPYTYAWNNGESQFAIYNLQFAIYNVTVSDAAGCIATGSTTVTEPNPISVTFSNITNPSCGLNDGTATANTTGGTPPYAFVWTNNDTLATADGLDAGIHSVIISDDNGCIAYGTLSLSSSNGPSIAFTKTDNNCSGQQNGNINLTVTGGFPPYSFEWSDGDTAQNRTGLVAGIYEVVVTASDSCIATATIEITSPAELSVEISKEDASCGIPDATAAATVTGGTPPYSYQWSTGSDQSSVNGLLAGVYFIAVSDANGCLKTKTVAINDIGGPVVEVVSMSNTGCGTMISGAIDIGVTGGSGGYSFLWSDSSTTQNVSGLSEGEYFVTVTDSAGCASVEHILIETTMPAAEPICIVTVDSATKRNLIVWDKTLAPPDIEEFRIYKEGTAAGVYNLIGSVLYSSSSEFLDMAANPLQRSWRYKIKTVDTCGNESDFSEVHKTMHLAINLGIGNKINLIWDPYEGFSYSTFVIYRGTNPNQIDSLDAIPSTLHSYTDLNPPQTPKLYYIVSAVHPTGCTVLQKVKKYNASKSNTSSMEMPIGIEELRIGDCQNCGLSIYPNPNNGKLTIEIQNTENRSQKPELQIINVFGQEVFQSPLLNAITNVSLEGLPGGMYFCKVRADGEVLGTGKLIIE